MQQPPPGGVSGAESPPHRPAASASLSAYTALTTIAVLSQSLWEVPLARAAPQTRHRHECSGATTGGRRHPHRPLLPPTPLLNYALLTLKPQHTTPGYVYNDMLGLRHQPEPTAALAVQGAGGGSEAAGGAAAPLQHPWRRPPSTPMCPPLRFPTSHYSCEQLLRVAVVSCAQFKLGSPPGGAPLCHRGPGCVSWRCLLAGGRRSRPHPSVSLRMGALARYRTQQAGHGRCSKR